MDQTPHIRLDGTAGGPWGALLGPPVAWLTCDATGRETRLIAADGRVVREWSDPLAALEWIASFDGVTDPAARWVGHLSYDLGRMFERLPLVAADELALPLFSFTLHDGLLDSMVGQTFLSALPITSLHRTASPDRAPAGDLRSNFTRPAYEAAVKRCIDYIGAGDVFQVNLSQRFSAALPAAPPAIYERLMRQSPARYGALLQYADYALICNSPELFLRVTPERTVVTRPIKGTRPRRPRMDVELRDSAKDQAELNMIIDLERNDLGRVCEIGSVRVTEPRAIEAHPTVYHGAATVEGCLRADVGFVDLLGATFPGGSVTGAPKIRAMGIIEELEPTRRGPYCGAIGYLAADGSMEFNVAIRTMIVKDGRVHIPVGGGIVADSEPAAEYEETLVKARAMFAALGIAAD